MGGSRHQATSPKFQERPTGEEIDAPYHCCADQAGAVLAAGLLILLLMLKNCRPQSPKKKQAVVHFHNK